MSDGSGPGQILNELINCYQVCSIDDLLVSCYNNSQALAQVETQAD